MAEKAKAEVKEKKTVPKIVPTVVKAIEKKTNIENNIRKLLSEFVDLDRESFMILPDDKEEIEKKAFRIFKDSTYFANPAEVWKNASPEQKYPYFLKSMFYVQVGPKYIVDSQYYDFNREVLSKLSKYNVILQRKFVDQYLGGNLSYKSAFINWKKGVDDQLAAIEKKMKAKKGKKSKEDEEEDIEEEDVENEFDIKVRDEDEQAIDDQPSEEEKISEVRDEAVDELIGQLEDVEERKIEDVLLGDRKLLNSFTSTKIWKKFIEDNVNTEAKKYNIVPEKSIIKTIKAISLKIKNDLEDFEQSLLEEDLTDLQKNIRNEVRQMVIIYDKPDITVNGIISSLETKYGNLSNQRDFIKEQINDTLKWLGEDPKNLYKSYVDRYIKMAQEVGIPDAEDLPLGLLLSKLSNRLKTMLSKISLEDAVRIVESEE